MLEAQYVTEPDVLVAVAKWLHSNGWQLEKISTKSKGKVKTEFTSIGIPIDNIEFRPEGEDIRARQGDTFWKIECKGLSGGTSQTVKNNFDRAVASTVSYYTQSDRLRLGLALPEGYNNYLRNKLPKALRAAVNLWIFLCVTKDEILVFAPNQEILLEE